MRTLVVLLSLISVCFAEPSITPIGHLVLHDGRILKNAVIRSFDAASSKVLILSERKALLIPIDLLAPAYADQARAIPATADLVQTTPIPDSTTQSPTTPVSPVVASLPATPVQPTPALPRAEPVDPVVAHMTAATVHARRYYKFEHRSGSNSIAVTDSDIAIDETEPVTGWTGRYRTTGKVYLEIYDSIGGGSFRRSTRRFEILTEQKPGERIKVVDFSSR